MAGVLVAGRCLRAVASIQKRIVPSAAAERCEVTRMMVDKRLVTSMRHGVAIPVGVTSRGGGLLQLVAVLGCQVPSRCCSAEISVNDHMIGFEKSVSIHMQQIATSAFTSTAAYPQTKERASPCTL